MEIDVLPNDPNGASVTGEKKTGKEFVEASERATIHCPRIYFRSLWIGRVRSPNNRLPDTILPSNHPFLLYNRFSPSAGHCQRRIDDQVQIPTNHRPINCPMQKQPHHVRRETRWKLSRLRDQEDLVSLPLRQRNDPDLQQDFRHSNSLHLLTDDLPSC